MFRKGLILFFGVLFIAVNFSNAQILDDSTKQVYGPETTKIYYQKDIYYTMDYGENPDTVVDGVHRYNWLTRNDNFYQDLGNIGTALYQVFYRPRRSLGVNYGVSIYDEYYKDPDEIRYYDTRSPFTEINYVQGMNNSTNLDLDFSRNVNSRWNVGFNVNRMNTDKALANVGRDRLVEHWFAAFKTSYISRNKRYHFLYHFTHHSHEVEEQGGIKPLASDRIPEDLYVYQAANVELNDAFSWERRNNHHIYHHYRIIPDSVGDFKIFHEFDRKNIKNRYSDNGLAESDSFYQQTFYENAQNTRYEIQYHLIDNKIGISGRLPGKFYYQTYARQRNYYSNLYDDWFDEYFVGGELFKTTRIGKDNYIVGGEAETQLPGDYRISAYLKSQLLEFEFYRESVSPFLVQTRFKSNSFIWDNNFQRQSSDNISLASNFRFGKQYFRPFANFRNVSDFVYYDENIRPVQASENINILELGLKHEIEFWKIHFDNHFLWTITESDIYRAPEFFTNASLYFETKISRGRSVFQVGFDAFYRSAYFGNAYMPAIFGHHLQNEFELQDAIIPDVFLNLQFRKAQAFLKVPYFIQEWAVPGYFITPYFTGLERPDAVTLGFRWQFYD